MAKANITTPDGTTINLEGTSDEIAALVTKFGLVSKSATPAAAAAPLRAATPAATSKAKPARKGKVGPAALIAEMIESGGFQKPKLFSEIRAELAQGGYHYERTSINPALNRALRNRELRRIKKDGHWAYVV
jgi:hypothetical protein